MVSKTILVLLSASMGLSACSTPKKSSYNTHLFPLVGNSISLDKTQIKMYIASAESQLLLLQQQESKRCISGQLGIAQSYLARATAEHNADMEKDAFITLIELDRQFRKIHCINKYIKGHLGCSYTNKKIVLKRWYNEGDLTQCANSSIAREKTKIEKKHILITETLHDFNQDEIKPIYYPPLNKLIELIKSYPSSKLLIRGHTDTTGSTSYNSELSKRRAQNVAKYFTEKGIDASQIVIENKGEESIREIEKNNASKVFNRYTSITLSLDTSTKSNI